LSADEGTALGKAHHRFLRGVDAHNASSEIRGPDAFGAFPGSMLDALLPEVPVIVPDTNILRLDLDFACGARKRGILVAAVNTGTLRLFCAQHVVNEVEQKLAEWAEYQSRPVNEYVDRWKGEYVPLLRMIQPDALSLDMLTPAERKRVTGLGTSKDVPSVTLALALGAFYLTKDRAAWHAVYGPEADYALRQSEVWFHSTGHGSDAGELGKLLHLATAIPVFLAGGAAQLIGGLAKKAPWLLVAAAAAAAALAVQVPRGQYARIGKGVWDILAIASEELFVPYMLALENFRKCAPVTPTWEDIWRETNDRPALRTRARLSTLARMPGGPVSAQTLSARIPCLGGVGKSAQLIRETLGGASCFYAPYGDGTWQVGRPLPSARSAITP